MKLYLKRSDCLFYLAFIIYYISLFIVYLPIDNIDPIRKILTLAACIFLMANLLPIVLDKITIKYKYIIPVICFLAILLISLLLKDLFLVITFLFGLNIFFRVQDIKPVLKISFGLLTLLTIMVILLCLAGILENVTTYREGAERYGLGFYHSNVLPLILVYLSAYYIIIKKDINVISFLVFEILGIIIFVLCDSRNALLSLQALLLFSLLTKCMKNKIKYKKALYNICLITVPLISLFSLILLHLYNQKNPFAVYCNDLFNNRIYMANLYYHYQDFKIINLMSPERYKVISLTLDNGYYYSIARYGVIFLLFIFAVNYYFARYSIKEDNRYALIAIIVIDFVNFIDNGFYSFMFYPFIIISLYSLAHKNEWNLNEFIYDKMKKIKS